MALFTKKKKETAPEVSETGDRLFSLGSSPSLITAAQAFEHVRPLAHAVATNHRLFLVLSGANLEISGGAAEWQFHYIYPDAHREAVFTIFTEGNSQIAGAAAISESVTAWPPAGSVQESMLQFQGPAARLIVEQQWNDRLDRLPGLPESFNDSNVALQNLLSGGADIDLKGTGSRLKGRTPPGAYPVWEIQTGFNLLQTPFTSR